jgi:hypothetical protein
MSVDDMTTATHYQRLWSNKADWTWGAGDIGVSRLAPNGVRYWTFGDTILGYPGLGTAFDPARVMVSNAIIGQRGAELFPATFANGSAAIPDMVVDEVTGRFWATDILFPSHEPDAAYVLCQRLHESGGTFVPDGAYLAEFAVEGDRLRYRTLWPTPTTPGASEELEIQWAQSFEEIGGYVYVFGYAMPGVGSGVTPHRSYVARVSVRHLISPYAWQIWTGTGWAGGTTATALANAKYRAAPILDGQVTSVRYQATPATRWLLAHKPWNGFGDTIEIHTASAPQGPWTLRQTASSPGGTSPGGNDYVTYYPVLHTSVDLVSGQTLVGESWNGTDFAAIFDERTLYQPRFRELTIP